MSRLRAAFRRRRCPKRVSGSLSFHSKRKGRALSSRAVWPPARLVRGPALLPQTALLPLRGETLGFHRACRGKGRAGRESCRWGPSTRPCLPGPGHSEPSPLGPTVPPHTACPPGRPPRPSIWSPQPGPKSGLRTLLLAVGHHRRTSQRSDFHRAQQARDDIFSCISLSFFIPSTHKPCSLERKILVNTDTSGGKE